MTKVLVVGGGASYQQMFADMGYELVYDLSEAELVQFTGGEDVSPVYYGELPHPRTYSNPRRDAQEAAIYQYCIAKQIPMLGICRGAQFLNVMNGGGLIQDVTGHALGGTHPCHSDLLGYKVNVTSTHHQMMVMGDGGHLEGWAWKLAHRKETRPDEQIVLVSQPCEPEVIYYEETNCLCFQPHPEYYGAEETRGYYFACIETFTRGGDSGSSNW